MHFQLRIELGNDAMQTADDVGRVLIDIGERLHGYGCVELVPIARAVGVAHTIRDDNGNTVGRWEVTA